MLCIFIESGTIFRYKRKKKNQRPFAWCHSYTLMRWCMWLCLAWPGLACIGLFIKNAIFNTIETRGFRWFATGLPLQRAIFFAIVSSLCNKIQIQCNVSNFYVCLFGKINHFLWLRLKFLLLFIPLCNDHIIPFRKRQINSECRFFSPFQMPKLWKSNLSVNCFGSRQSTIDNHLSSETDDRAIWQIKAKGMGSSFQYWIRTCLNLNEKLRGRFYFFFSIYCQDSWFVLISSIVRTPVLKHWCLFKFQRFRSKMQAIDRNWQK